MAKSIRKTLLLAKIQTAEGVDPVPTGAANAILLRNVTATPLSAEFVERAAAALHGQRGSSGDHPVRPD